VSFLNKQRPVYIYCLSGGRSQSAAQWMRGQGFTQVVEMAGGMRAWKAANLPTVAEAPVKEMSTESFQRAVASQAWVLVDVGAPWCPPCRKMEPDLQAFLKQHPQIERVNVDGGNDKQVMQALNSNVLPTLVLYHQGKEVWRKAGIATQQELEQVWEGKQ